ncbi:alpha/beta fold hydrolase [Pseudomonas sp. BN414]|uniref:alpha/beta fold hydrolase n=1 Tax=Pseudomonas sp. BN414 TaxID=2567888 RepID=UPI002456F6D7|nr:alpha/beta fold hydrolase [Pseudomonas sp. BN414]MDH4565173.1 alpha/beta fold hydrolase [Pseudomonas sp. BN414]
MKINKDHFISIAQSDAELRYKLRELTALIRLALGEFTFELSVENGELSLATAAGAKADITISGPDSFWERALVAHPEVGFESLSVGQMHGVVVEGDFEQLLAPYQGALQRLFLVLRKAVADALPLPTEELEPYWETDCAIGRYVFVQSGEAKARVYYEEAGHGPITLVLQHTAGADSRQYRHMLANPELQRRFRMIAWDLPSHGKSLPPIGSRWWEEAYRPTKVELLDWSTAIVKALQLDKPIYLGCSVGGQLALDLAAHHADHYRAFVALNGWYEIRSRGHYNNDLHRKPTTSTDFFASRILAATAPGAPEASAQEVYWVYRSNFPGVYAGDNDYFMNQHDLREDGHLIDTTKTPVLVVTGEFDGSQLYPENGGAAVARHIPGVEHIVLPGLGHFAPSDDPVRFCEAIIPILDRLAQQSE